MANFWTACYQAHFQRFFQKPFDIQIFHDQAGVALKIAIHDWALHGYHVLASMGLADKLADSDEDDFGEVILHSDVPDKEVPELFVNALFFILHNDIPLGSRFAIGGIAQMRPAFAERYRKTALYFTLAQDENESFNKVRNGDEFGHVYQAFFITPTEERYLDAYGPDAFEKKLYTAPDDICSIRRRFDCTETDDDTNPERQF
jgi:antitoxin YqcF